MRSIKKNISSLVYFFLNSFVLRFPSRTLRRLVLSKCLGHLGKDSSFLRFVEIRNGRNISIGSHTVINQRVLLDGRGGKLTIGENVDIAQDTNIWTLGHDPHGDYHESKGGNVTIEDYVWIASRVTILPNIIIGRGAVVAANSVVTKSVPAMAIVAGSPAKIVGTRKSKLLYNLDYRPWLR
jgi:acetyltransferase-like isoleucine patch superfamily enzyme